MSLLPALLVMFAVAVTTAPERPDTVEVVVPADSLLALNQADGLEQAEGGPEGHWVTIEVPLEGTVEQTLDAVSEEVGEPVFEEAVLEQFDPVDEPLFPEQWHHHNVGQGGGSADADIDTPTAWGRSTGFPIVVAVIDSGVDLNHPDLVGRIFAQGVDFVDGDEDPSPGSTSSDDAHGTMVAGVIAAPENGFGTAGVAPDARIMAVRACSNGSCDTSAVANGIMWAVDHHAEIINLSIGAILSDEGAVGAAVHYARSFDVTVIAAAGNASPGIDLDALPPGQILVPGGLPYSNVIGVAATDRFDRLAGFSNYGRTTIDVAAPGVEILTTDSGGGHVFADGTSFSSPVVAGVAALLLETDPGIAHQELVGRIKAFVDSPGIVGSRVETGRVNAGRTLTRRFIDTSNSVFLAAIDQLAAIGITQGCDPPVNIRYCPENLVTRGQMAVFLTRVLDPPQTSTDFFVDDEGAFYEDAANRMAAAGITTGCAPNRYCGERQIPRGQMAAMLSRGLDLPAAGGDFFVDDETSEFEGAINRVATAGITFGCNPPNNNRFCPGDSVTRGQMAGFIRRSMGLINS